MSLCLEGGGGTVHKYWAKLWTRRGLGQERAHRVGNLITPDLSSSCEHSGQTTLQHQTRIRGHPLNLLNDQMQRNISKNADRMDTKSNKGPSGIPCGHLSIYLYANGILAEQRQERPFCFERNRWEVWTLEHPMILGYTSLANWSFCSHH